MDGKINTFLKKHNVTFVLSIYFFISIVYSEVILNLFTIGGYTEFSSFLFMFLFSCSISVFLGGICAAFKAKTRTVLSFVFAILLYIIYAIQFVYHGFCHSFMRVAQLGMGGDAMEAFGGAIWLEILESIGGLLLLLLPIAALIVLKVFKAIDGDKTSWKVIICEAIIFFLIHFGTVLMLPIGGKALLTPYHVYHYSFKINKSVEHFGALTTLRIEIRNMFFGKEAGFIASGNNGDSEGNAFNINFEELAKEEENADIKSLHEYFATVDATNKNEYTGKFKDYNLVVIAVESFSHHLIDKKLTPTLYKMATEGFVFNNYYNTVSDNTSNGEYALLTGLIPDTTLLGQGWKTFYNYNSFTTSKDNLMPFCLGNQFIKNGGHAFAIHNHTASYYGRNKTHPNLGYEFLAFGQGLERVETYPTSDVSMMEQSIPALLERNENGEITPFHAYFLTFSGHMPYVFNEEHNDMTVKNQKYVENLPYSSRVRAYISCQLELEFALEYMLEEFEKAGILENTLIAITNDHYPYPLDSIHGTGELKYLSELAGKKLDNHWDKYRSGLILWSASMEAPIEVDAPCCSLDVLPTLSNLLGLEYDSRLMAGKDIFSDTEHIAILADFSFVTDKVMFNATNGEITLREGVSSLEDGYIERLQNEIQNRFTMSSKVLYNDYYRVLFK
ncbi:MAG: LTA synthase family protein [Ruminococcaceae bacterium]|nr:LTA synthase family protein [Oscillospiraceae bacterium]